MSIQQIDKYLQKYYESLQIPYNSLFADYCNANALDDDLVAEEFDAGADDCILVDFDENFPFPKPPKNEADRNKKIFDLIKKGYQNPALSFAPSRARPFVEYIEFETTGFEVEYKNQLNSNIIVFGYLRSIIDASIISFIATDVANICLSFYCFQVNKLQINDKIDHRDTFGQFCVATIIDKRGENNFKIHYDGWSEKFDIWSNSKTEINRFTEYESISKRKAIANRFKGLSVGDYVDINVNINKFLCKYDGWKAGEVAKFDDNSGQIQIKILNDGLKIWVHLDNDKEIRESSLPKSNYDKIKKADEYDEYDDDSSYDSDRQCCNCGNVDGLTYIKGGESICPSCRRDWIQRNLRF
eukprot:419_1